MNMEMTEFIALFKYIKNNNFWVLKMITLNDWFEIFLKEPILLTEYESRYDCSVINIPFHEKVPEFLSNLIGYNYTDPWRHCRIYDHQVKVFNLNYGKLILPDHITISLMSLAMAIGLVLLMLILANDWILQKGEYIFNSMGMIKVHVWRDDFNIYRAVARGLLGERGWFRGLSRQLQMGTPFTKKMHSLSIERSGKASLGPLSAAEEQIATNFELRYDIVRKFQTPISVYLDSYKSQISLFLPECKWVKPVNINQEEDGYYTALVPSRLAWLQYILLRVLCFPYSAVFRGGRRV